jgi:hypothetical protein
LSEIAASLLDLVNRKSRADLRLDASAGLYALFLRPGRLLPEFVVHGDAPVYIGKADGSGGLKRRCHFHGGTRNHSPRKSLAAILRERLGLAPRPVVNADTGAYKTWELEPESEQTLDRWMHDNLLVSIVLTKDAAVLEGPLIRDHSPLLNLTECSQGEPHMRVRRLRHQIEVAMRARVIDVTRRIA